jgi:hypothetical protein
MKTLVQQAKKKNIVVLDRYATADDILDALEDINTQHTEDSTKQEKTNGKTKKIREKKSAWETASRKFL